MSSVQGAVPQTQACYFYLSYAPTPRHPDDHDPDSWVHTLYLDLCRDVAHLTGASSADVGFMDREAHLSTEWPPSVSRALATCRAFVPLYSPRYFESEACGREWSAFARRPVGQDAADASAASAIVPALWKVIGTSSMPEAARAVSFDHQQIGSVYSNEGFYGIIKLSLYRQDYDQAVRRLARRIVDVGNRVRVEPSDPPDYRSSGNAFDRIRQPGGRRIRLIVAAHDTRSLPNGRNPLYYGQTAGDWNPYRPKCSQALAEHAAEVTRRHRYRPTVSLLDEGQPNLRASKNKEPDEPGLLLVDPWTAASADRLSQLSRFDADSAEWESVLVPMNREDAETTSAEPVLKPHLRQALRRMLSRVPQPPDECHVAREGIPSLEVFDEILPKMAAAMSRRYLRNATPYPPSGPPSRRPLL